MEINQYAVTASEMKDLSFLDIDQYVSAGVYQSQKVPVSLVKALMLSENIEQTNVIAAQALVTGSDLVALKTYILDDADAGARIIKVMAAGGVTNQFYQFAIDVSTGEIGTYDITTDVFSTVSGIPDLQQVTDVGFNTTNKILSDDAAGNYTEIGNGEIKIGTGNTGEVIIDASLVTAAYNAQLPDKPTSPQTFAMLSDVTAPDIQQVLDTGNTSTTPIKIDDGTGNYVQVNSSNILMEDSSGNALSVYPNSITIQNPSFGAGTIKATALANNVFFELPNKAAGTQTFAMLSDIGAGSGTVTSVGLSMPSAFSVASSPVTTSGTIAVTGAGLTSQYVRGDGSLANFPSSGGGGASVNYYLNGSVSQGTFGGVAMREINKVPIIGTGTDFTIATNGYIQSFITDANDPNQLSIPAGNWNFETFFSASSGGGSPSFYIELHKWDGTTLTLIATSSATPEGITGGTAIDLYTTALAVPQTTLA